MSDNDFQSKHPIVPPNELRCVWMTAGMLSYQLCERKFECEECPLDRALRQRFVNREAALGSTRATPPVREPEESHGTTLYGRKHVWVRSEEGNNVRVGIEPGFASVLRSPKAVVLPALGEHIVRDKAGAWIVLDGGTLPIVSPVSGRVIATNTRLAENPHAVCLSPLEQGWLFELSMEGPLTEEPSDIFEISDVARVYADDERRLQAMFSAELAKSGTNVGPTLADGGQALDDIAAMLGPLKYFKLIRNIFG